MSDKIRENLNSSRLEFLAGEVATDQRINDQLMDDGFCVIQMIYDDGMPVDYRFIKVNSAFQKQAGQVNVIGRTIRELIPDANAKLFGVYDRVSATGEPTRFVSEAKEMGRWYDVYAYKVGGNESREVGILFRDITERKVADSERVRLLAEVESKTAFIQEVIRQVPVGILVAEAATGRLLLSNDEASRISGAPYELDLPVSENDVREPMQGFRPDGQRYGSEDWPLTRAMQGETVQGEEIELLRGDGSRLSIRVNATPIRDPDGELSAAVVAFHDVTIEKQAEAALREADRKKDEFLAVLAHELRNPLAPLRNGLQIIRLANGDPNAIEEVHSMMERQFGQLVHLVDDLLDLSRITSGKIELRKERLELAKVIQQAVETSRPAIEHSGHALLVEVPSVPIYVDADQTRLAQVFANILNNAAKYTQRGGTVRIFIQQSGTQATISVRDNGIGIPASMLPRVFEMFTQVDRNLERSQGGLGIGLSVVKRLLEMHGGSVEARSDGHGMGSEFIVSLPVVSPALRPLNDADEIAQPLSHRILVADDNKDAARSLALMLRLMGNEVKTAHDGLEAFNEADDYRPDLILLDIGMPKMNGYQTARKIREQTWGKKVCIVALTGWGQEEDRRKSNEAGFDSHMVKPIEPAAMEKLLAKLPASTD